MTPRANITGETCNPIGRLNVVILLLVMSTPFVFQGVFGGGMSYDLRSFEYWRDCLKSAVHPPFSPCSPELINYPTVGLYASAGVMWGLEVVGLGETREILYRNFQLFLGIVDALNLLTMYLILRSLGCRLAAVPTLLFSILPSTWAGASLWGQIDTVTQLSFSLAYLCALLALHSVHRDRKRAAHIYGALFTLLIVSALLTKQHAIFSLPALGILWIYLQWQMLQRRYTWAVVTSVVLIPLFGVYLDSLFPTPDGYFGSGLFYVLSEGSGHAGKLSMNGISLASLLPYPESASSKATYHLFTIGDYVVSVVPYTYGIVAFTGSLTLFITCMLRAISHLSRPNPITIVIFALCVASFSHLAMNTFFSGTHERYMFHYGFFITPLVFAALPQSSWAALLRGGVIVHLSLYGLLVFETLMYSSTLSGPIVFDAHAAKPADMPPAYLRIILPLLNLLFVAIFLAIAVRLSSKRSANALNQFNQANGRRMQNKG